MPYKIVKSRGGYYVENKDTGKRFSNSPIPKSHAQAQLKALYASENGYRLSPERRAFYSARRAKSSRRSLKRRSVKRK
jgi:hypothetical protein